MSRKMAIVLENKLEELSVLTQMLQVFLRPYQMPSATLYALELTLEAIGDFSAESLPQEKLLELDHADEFPVDVVRAMCGEELGVQLRYPGLDEGLPGCFENDD